MERLTMTSDKGGVAFTFDLEVNCRPSEALKILRLAEKLKEYEDLEEQGLLLRLPCKVGDTFWELNEVNGFPHIYPRMVSSLSQCFYVLMRLGKTAFLTRDEAEQALREMGE